MKIGNLEPKVGQWQFLIELSPASPDRWGFHPYCRLAFLNLRSLPDEGAVLSKENYQGIYWHFHIRLYPPNILLRLITLQRPRVLQRFLRHEFYQIVMPEKLFRFFAFFILAYQEAKRTVTRSLTPKK